MVQESKIEEWKLTQRLIIIGGSHDGQLCDVEDNWFDVHLPIQKSVYAAQQWPPSENPGPIEISYSTYIIHTLRVQDTEYRYLAPVGWEPIDAIKHAFEHRNVVKKR
jgi:hypothetical protein